MCMYIMYTLQITLFSNFVNYLIRTHDTSAASLENTFDILLKHEWKNKDDTALALRCKLFSRYPLSVINIKRNATCHVTRNGLVPTWTTVESILLFSHNIVLTRNLPERGDTPIYPNVHTIQSMNRWQVFNRVYPTMLITGTFQP